jgi:hypothetical protein
MATSQIENLKLELEQLEAAEQFRIKHYGIETYTPNSGQYRAHQSKCRTILYIGGNRAGKSTFGAAELAFHLTKQYPPWFPEERRFKGPIKAMISATEYPVVQRVIEPKIRALLPTDYWRAKKNRDYLARIICKDGSTVDILTLEMKNEAYESADWDFIWCDEPQSQAKYQAMRRGLVDRGGQLIITFTPLTEPWMKEELVDKADGKFVECFTVNIRDNLTDIKGNEILNEEKIAEFEASLPEDVKDTRIHGQFFHLRGQVYKSFSEAHTDPGMVYSQTNRLPVIGVLDPHDRQPHHMIWAFLDEEGDIHVDYEMIVHCELPDLAKKIKKVEKERHYKMKKRLIDPNFGRKPSASGSNVSVMQELAKNGASFYEADDDVELGHMVVREYLHYDRKKPVTAVNKPKLFFSTQRCPNTIRSMRNLQYEEWKGATRDERNPKETQKSYEDHGADCVRYLCISRPRYQRKRPSNEKEDGPFY